ncbi:GPI-anchored protein [Salix suchowensis]|nr:GPI-anchored protein [Salix suchowensis]
MGSSFSGILACCFIVSKSRGFPFPKFNGAGRLVKYGEFPDFQLSKGFQVAVALQTPLEPNHVSSTSELGTPPISGLFGPIEISPSVLPRYPYPGENLAPMYPTFPTTYEPNLTGKCPVNFTAMSNVIDRTASDCSQPLAALVGNKIVNTSKLLEACSTVDPLKECCRPICQSAIMEAALEISGTQLTINDYKDSVTVPNHNDPLSDCKGVVFSYISRKLSADAASSAFRIFLLDWIS